jgi:hypothetical protein
MQVTCHQTRNNHRLISCMRLVLHTTALLIRQLQDVFFVWRLQLIDHAFICRCAGRYLLSFFSPGHGCIPPLCLLMFSHHGCWLSEEYESLDRPSFPMQGGESSMHACEKWNRRTFSPKRKVKATSFML